MTDSTDPQRHTLTAPQAVRIAVWRMHPKDSMVKMARVLYRRGVEGQDLAQAREVAQGGGFTFPGKNAQETVTILNLAIWELIQDADERSMRRGL